MRMHFEDFEIGQTFELGSRTLSKEEMLAFANDFDAQPFHVDEEAAKNSMYGGLIASGWHTGSVLMGLLAKGLLNRTTSQGAPGLEQVRWFKPVYPGETLDGFTTVEDTKVSKSKPHLGLVLMTHELRNGNGDTVVRVNCWGIFTRRGHD